MNRRSAATSPAFLLAWPRGLSAAFVIAALFLALGIGSASAAPGDLDTAFGGDGRVTTSFTLRWDPGSGVAIQADEKIVAVGSAGGISTSVARFALVRYDTDGTLDPSFGGDGRVTTVFRPGFNEGSDVAIQADGKIVVVGYANARFAVARYDTDGSLDPSFGGDGKVTTRFTRYDAAAGLAIQADGKIVVVGTAALAHNHRLALVRYNTNGRLDNTFGGDGRVMTRSLSEGRAVVIQAGGEIVANGEADGVFAVARFHADGTLDATFGGDGTVTTGKGGRADAVEVQADGKIVASGRVGGRFAVVRYLADGTLDAGFGGDGITIVHAFGKAGAEAFGVAIQMDDSVVAAGVMDGFRRTAAFALVRLEPDGTLDATFGASGTVTTNFAGAYNRAEGVAIESDGGIVAAGFSQDRRNRVAFALARYLGS